MKKFFSFFSKAATFFAFVGVILYCTGHFFTSKTRRINELFNKKNADDTQEG